MKLSQFYIKYQVIVFFVLLLSVGTFGACGKEKSPSVYVRGGFECAYEDTLFYYSHKGSELRFQNLTAIMEEGLPLYSDLLVENDESPFTNMISEPFIMVDEEATKKNGDRPVLLMACTMKEVIITDSVKYRTFDRIISYATDTQKVTVLYELEESIQSFDLYGDHIYFTTNEGEMGWNVHRIDKNGKNHIKMENPEGMLYRVLHIEGERCYLSDGVSGVYSVDLNLKDLQCLVEDAVPGTLAAGVGDDLFYIKYGQQITGEDGRVQSVLYDFYRAPLSDLSAGECVIPDVAGVKLNNGKFYYYLDTVEAIKSRDYTSKHDILYEYSIETDSHREVYNITDEERHVYSVAFSDRYVICWETNQEGSVSNMVAIDLETGAESKVPF